MLIRLRKRDYETVRPLFQGLSYQAIIPAVLSGTSPGAVWADDAARPRTAFLASPEGCFLAGDPGNEALNRALNELIVGDILARNRAIVVIPQPDAWEHQLAMGEPPRLHADDDWHASRAGQYLNALVIYSTIYGRRTRGLVPLYVDDVTLSRCGGDGPAAR